MPNVSLLPGEKDTTLDDIIAATDRGILIKNRGSWSIDHQRYNFSFSGQAFYEIKGGKIAGMLKDVAYQSNTPVFWDSMDMIGGPKSVLARRRVHRRQGRAVAIELGEPRLSAGALPQRQHRQHREGRLMTEIPLLPPTRSSSRATQAKALTDRVLAIAKADETRVNIRTAWSGNTRFAGNQITTNGGTTDTIVTITSHDRQAARVGARRTCSTTRASGAPWNSPSARRSLSPEDPEIMPELGPQQYATVNGYFETTANLVPEARAAAAKKSIDDGRRGRATRRATSSSPDSCRRTPARRRSRRVAGCSPIIGHDERPRR